MYVHEFIEYVKQNPSKFIGYCEIIIDEIGRVELAIPSHCKKLEEMICTKQNITIDQLREMIPIWCDPSHWIMSKENYISVWYYGIIRPEKINRFQKRTLDLLKSNDIIDKGCTELVTREYQLYLERMSYEQHE